MNTRPDLPVPFRRRVLAVLAGALLPLAATSAITATTATSETSFCRFEASAPPASRSELSIDLPPEGDPARRVIAAVPPDPNDPIGEPVQGSLAVAAAIADRPHYAAGDLITLTVQTSVEGAAIEIGFSAVDSTYVPGSGRVEEVGRGLYRVQHRIDPRNRRLSGVYRLPISVRLGTRVESRPEAAVEVTYLPRGRGLLEALSGRFLAPDPVIPAGPAGSSPTASIVGARFLQADRTQLALNPRAAGTLQLDLASPAPLQPGEADLEIAEDGRDGHWEVPLAPGAATCSSIVSMASTGCRMTAEVAIERGGVGMDAARVSLSLRLTRGGVASAPFFLPGLDLAAAPFEHTHRLSGHLRFRYQRRGPDITGSQDRPDYPQYTDVFKSVEARPIGDAKIVLQDECGHWIKGTTSQDGSYAIEWTPVNCGQGTLTVWSIAAKGSANAAVGAWRHDPIDSFDDLTTATADYLVYSYTWSFDTADAAKSLGGLTLDADVPDTDVAAKAFRLLDRAVAAQLYYHDIPGVGFLPKLNVVYSPEKRPENAPDDWDGKWATYLPDKDPGFIWIPAEPSDYGWNAFAMLHETGHYFHLHYLRSWEYGRLSEPLANAQAGAIAGSPWFDKQSEMESLDAQPNFEDGAFRGADWEMCDLCPGIVHSYGWVQRVFWDLLDGDESSEAEPIHDWIPEGEETGETFPTIDLLSGGGGNSGSTDADDHLLNDVLIHYLGGGLLGSENGAYVDRGIQEADMVDVLDGMICRGHATESQIETLVNDAMGFGYDSMGPASCP